MPGDVGMVAGLLNTVAGWVLSEDGYAEWNKRREGSALNKLAKQQLADRDYTALRDTISRLKRLSNAP